MTTRSLGYLVAAVEILLLTACAGSDSVRSGAQPRTGPALPAAPAAAGLPTPLELTRGVSAENFNYPLEYGGDWSKANPSVAKVPDEAGDKGVFTTFGPGIDFSAWAIYKFHVPQGADPGIVCANWSTLPDQFYLAVADYASNSWNWRTGINNTEHPIDEAVDCINDAQECYVVVLSTGFAEGTLDSVCLASGISIELTPDGGFDPLELDITVNANWDPTGTLGNYSIDFGDNYPPSLDQGNQVSHTYEGGGHYIIRADVRDDGGAHYYAARHLVVDHINLAPVARIDYVAYADGAERRNWATPGEDLYFSFDNSFDPDDNIDHFNVDWDSDGTFEEAFVSEEVTEISHSWDTPGPHTATLRATDNYGATATDTVEVYYLGGFVDESEPNNTYSDANSLPQLPILHYSGVTDGAADVNDWYSFTLATPQFIRAQLHMEGYPGQSGPALTLYAGDGSTVLDDPGVGKDLVYECDVGTYYLESTCNNDGTFDYDLQLCSADAPPQADLSCDVLIGEVPLIVHCEAYPLQNGCDVGAQETCWDINNADGNCDTTYVYNPVENERAFDVVIYDVGTFNISVQVTDLVGDISSQSIDISTTGTVIEAEPDDSSAQARPIVLVEDPIRANQCLEAAPGILQWVHNTEDHEDWYSVDVGSDGNLIITCGVSRTCYATIELFQADGSTMVALGDTLDTSTCYLKRNVTPGRYFIRIKAETNAEGNRIGAYRLSLRLFKTPDSPEP